MILLPDIVNRTKRCIGSGVWIERDGSRVEATISLAFETAVVQGLTIRIGALTTMPDTAVSINLLYEPSDARCTNLMRIEWNPLRPHTNPIKGPKRLRQLRITGSHIHEFQINYDQRSNGMKEKNLPFAKAIEPNPTSFGSLLKYTERAFKIEGLTKSLEAPPWRPGSLFEA